jgi:hypothetical protein
MLSRTVISSLSKGPKQSWMASLGIALHFVPFERGLGKVRGVESFRDRHEGGVHPRIGSSNSLQFLALGKELKGGSRGEERANAVKASESLSNAMHYDF